MSTEVDLLAATLAAPALTAGLAFALGRRAPRRMARAGALVAGAGFAASAAMALGSARGQTASWTALGAEFAVDRLAAALLLLVFGVSGIVQAFAVRYLAGDRRAAWFTGGAGLLTAASAGLATAGNLVTLAVCWTLAGVALCLLLGTYWHLPAARDGVRRTALAFLVGDAALWAAVAAITLAWGRVGLGAGGAAVYPRAARPRSQP